MLPPLKAGVILAQPNGPVIETERLKLRQWCGADVAPNAAMRFHRNESTRFRQDASHLQAWLCGLKCPAPQIGQQQFGLTQPPEATVKYIKNWSCPAPRNRWP